MLDFFLYFFASLAALIVMQFARSYLPAYFDQKAKNRATVEDVHSITDITESAKLPYAISAELHKQHGQLRLAALDRRLEVAQEAYSRWWSLVRALHTPQVTDEVISCQDFWVRHNLYLAPDAAFAFRQAFRAAGDHASIKEAARLSPEGRNDVEANFRRITEAGDVIVRSASLPSLESVRTVAEDLQKVA